MSSSIVATVLLLHRKGISDDELLKKACWIYEEISAKNGHVS
jgi:hypothetical protein